MYRFLAAAALLPALIAPGSAAPPPDRGKLPAVFVGRWCVIQTNEPSDTVSIHHRAPCRRDEGQVTMRSHGFETYEIRCKLLIAAAATNYGQQPHPTAAGMESSRRFESRPPKS